VAGNGRKVDAPFWATSSFEYLFEGFSVGLGTLPHWEGCIITSVGVLPMECAWHSYGERRLTCLKVAPIFALTGNGHVFGGHINQKYNPLQVRSHNFNLTHSGLREVGQK